MKKLISLALYLTLQSLLHAQSVTTSALGNLSTNASGTDYTVVGRSANTRTWGTIVLQTNTDGSVVTGTNRGYTELGANLCVQNAQGNWSDASSALVIVPDGAASSNSPLAAHFAGDAIAGGGTLRVTAPDGKVFVSKVYGISYYDATLETNILIAPLQSSQGQLVGDHHILYAKAFAGLDADLWYSFTPSRIDQDIVLHESPPAPAAYGLNPQTARLQVWTEWINVPKPRQVTRTDDGIEHEAYLDWGNLIMVPGSALFTQGQADASPVDSGPIYKHWRRIAQRDWLIEEVRYTAIANVLQALPQHAAAGRPGRGMYESIAAVEGLSPEAGPGKPVQVAENYVRGPSLILDYITVASANNFTFNCDTTYLISSNVTLGGTNTVFEGGTILKYTTNSSLTVNSPVTWLGSEYRPVVMTAKDDNTMGDGISGSTGNPWGSYYANPALAYTGNTNNTNLMIDHWRVLNAKTALSLASQSNNVLSHVQMVNCATGIQASNASYSLLNALMYNVMTNFSGNNATGDIEHLTSDTANYLNNGQTLNLTNCLLVAVANTGSYGGASDYTVSSRNGVFQRYGDGFHYLNSNYIYTGTITINSTLATALAQMTVFPPVVYSNTTVLTGLSLGNQATRDSENPGPIVGYHYDPLDYVFGGTQMNSNLYVSAGTGVGWFNASSKGYGIYMTNKMTANFTGTVTAPVWWARANAVQEGGTNTIWPGAGATGGMVGKASQYNEDATQSPIANLFFTKCSILAFGDGGGLNHFRDSYGYMTVNAEHSEINGGVLGGYVISCCFTNCLVNRVLLAQVEGHSNNVFILTNCTFFNGFLTLTPGNRPVTIAVRDSAEDGTTNSFSGYGANSAYASYDYNALYNTTGAFPFGGSHNASVPNGFNWQTSWFGRFYQPTNTPCLNAGDLTADQIGLYHFTILTNQVIEGNSTVDIGYHYVATDSEGNPLDTNGDGIPDYLEDANGNGLVDNGEQSWLVSLYNGLSYTNGLVVFTPLK